MSAPRPPTALDRKLVARRLALGAVALIAALASIGWFIVNVLTPSAFTQWEDSVNLWFYDRRTPTLDAVTHVGSYLAETVTCIALLVVVVLIFRVWLGRWRESWAVFAAIVGELLVFLVVTAVVNRERPGIPHLDAAPPTSSFPSGHTAAAVAIYGCIAIVVARNMTNRLVARLLVAVCVAIPVIVAASRVYRGMHHPSDLVFGALGGGAWLVIVITTLLVSEGKSIATDKENEDSRPSAPGSLRGTTHAA